MEQEKLPSPRNCSVQFRALVLEQCAAPGTSVARVALSHGMNANIVHRWRREARDSAASVSAREFVPVSVSAPVLAQDCAEAPRRWRSHGPVLRQASALRGCESCCDDSHRFLVACR